MSWLDFYEARYTSKTAQTILRSETVKSAEHARIEERIKSYVELPVTAAVLDVGGGPATYLSSLNTVTTDLSLNALRMSKRVDRVQCDAMRLPFGSECFDLIVCSQVLEHVPDWQRALREIVRVAKVGAAIYIAVPNRYALMKRRYHPLQRKIDASGHIHEFREFQLVFELQELGVGNLKTSGACYDLFWISSALERSKLARFAVPLLDKIDARVLRRLFIAETRMRAKKLDGFSLEIIGTKG